MFFDADLYPNLLGVLPGEYQGRHDNAGNDGNGEIGQYGNDGDRQPDDDVSWGHLAEQAEAAPFEGFFTNDEHEADQRGEWDQFYPFRQKQDEAQQRQRGDDAR